MHMVNELRKSRFLSGEMTQEELARRVGVSRQTIIAIEKGKYNPSVLLALKIARVFDRGVEDICWCAAGIIAAGIFLNPFILLILILRMGG
jgi:putative transcriptional regulator